MQLVVEQASQAAVHLVAEPEPEAVNAYYVDSPSDEEGGAAVEAHIDFVKGDLELLYREQLASLAEDLIEYQTVKKGKAVATDPSPQKDHPSIMVLEEDSAATPTRPDQLITPQPGGGSRWFVQHMSRLGNAASGNRQISHSEDSRQSDVPPASTSKDAEEETIATVTTEVVARAAAAATERTEEPDQSASPETARAKIAH